MASSNILELNDANFDTEIKASSVPVLVDFWAPWCGPCKMIAPILDRVADQTVGRARVAKVNVDDSTATASRFRVQSIPTLLFIKDGEVRDQVIGVTSEADLLARLQALG